MKEEKNDTYSLIKKTLHDKSSLKQDVFEVTTKSFDILKKQVHVLTDKLTKEVHVKDYRLNFSSESKGEFEIQAQLASDMLYFHMHTNIFLFDQANPLWKTSYLTEDPSRAYCGVINVVNFLADSIKYNRLGDVGYLIARIFINKEGHFMVQGKRQLGFLYNDFMNSTFDEATAKKVVESIFLYTIDFDLLTTPYDHIKEVTVMELRELSDNIQIKTGKRLGFKFQADNDEIE